jgi:predicted aldo/keto reductase-like oxidoreductase
MKYKKLGKADADISIISLGGHEYLADKRSRGFNEDFESAITPGHIFDGFGQENRKKVLKTAFDNGINFLDVTMDSEKEALGRNLKEIPPPYPIYIQTRPEGFVYMYDDNNVKMGDYNLLKAEVVRILGLLQRERLEFFNFAFMKEALKHDSEYMGKICHNIKNLKKEGLIQFACADTFSGELTYLNQIESDCFDAVYINFNFGDNGCLKKVLPRASEFELGIIAREAFMKGQLFKMAKDAGAVDNSKVASAALKWCLSHPEVTTVVYGTGNTEHLISALDVVENSSLSEAENDIIERIKKTATFESFEKEKKQAFFQN